ncbi:MAG: ABC transporter permease [Patescibacteria group bacterium]|nr:ABC transporter permease [Patescibacteria group bacterium]
MFFIAIKNLFQEKTKLAISIGGVVFAVLLIIIINGVYQGFNEKMGAYPKSIPADLWVEQEGVGDMYHTLSFLPDNLEGKFLEIDGVEKADKYLGRQVMFDLKGKDQTLFIVGIDQASGVTKPFKMEEGSWQNLQEGQIIIDQSMAKDEKLKVGDSFEINGQTLEISGISSGGNVISFKYAYVSYNQAKKMFNLGDKVNFYLLKLASGSDASQVKADIEQENVKVLTKKEFVDASQKVVTESFLPIIAVLVAIGLLVGTAVIGLTTYSATIEKSREYGVMKAIGLSNGQLFKTVIIGSLVSGVIGYIIGALLAYVISFLSESIVSSFVTEIRQVDLLWVFGATILMSLIGAYIPMKRIFSIDPAEVFKN